MNNNNIILFYSYISGLLQETLNSIPNALE